MRKEATGQRDRHINKAGLKAAILTMSFIQMATNAVSAVLADIAAAFPEASVTAVQYLMTFPNLMVVVASLAAGIVTRWISKRYLAAGGLFLAVLAGLFSFFFHGSIVLLFVWAGLLGIGVGFVVPVANSLIADFFDGGEKEAMLGYQTGAANAGSMIMTFVGGIIAVFGWYWDYLVYFLAVPGLILTLLFVPEMNAVSGSENGDGRGSDLETGKMERNGAVRKRRSGIWLSREEGYCFVTGAVFMLFFYLGPTNMSILVEERGTGSAAVAGTAASLILFGGFLAGLFFGKIAGKIGKNTVPLGFLLLSAGYFLIYAGSGIPLLYMGSFLVGTSNALVLPQCMGGVAGTDKRRTTVLMSAVFAAANLGTFLAPALTGLSAAVMGTESAESRFLFAGILTLVLAVAYTIYLIVFRGKTVGNRR